MGRSPLSALADVLTLAGEGLDALFVLSLDVIRPSGRPAPVRGRTQHRLLAVSQPGGQAMTRSPSGGANPSLGVAGGGAQGRSVRAGVLLGGSS